uniref:DNA-directed DNA polymerase n=1 Tax=Globodera pallida TaxID=36090 RepID=A0A183CGF3_GLOPA
MLNFIWGSAYPEDVLKALFSMSLAYAVKGAEGMKIVADHFIFLLSARHLDYEIALHFKKIDNTTAETILTRFEMVDQSNKSKERPSICEESFVIDITAIDSGGKRKKLAGKGRPREFSVNYNIHQGATFDLTNNDNFCLFRAFEFLRMKFVLPQQRFSEYKRTASWQLNDVRVLCRACNIDLAQPFYSVEEYGERIQAFYDQLNPGMFRLFCFETSGKMKPSWKSEVGEYQHELCVLYTDGDDGGAGHYDAIKAIGRLWNQKGNYCFGAQDKQKGHICGQKFCRVCLGFHAPRDCYISYRPKAKKEKRFIFFDFECTTHFKPDPEILRFKHQVNFCYAHVTCTRCIEKEVWDQELDRACAICGPLRYYSWAPFHYDNTDVDRHFKVDDPLAAFTKWLLNFEAEDVDWCKPADMVGEDGDILEGIIKCFVVPPRHAHCDIPVLPLRMNKRTLFPLCRKCSELFPNGAVDREYSCPHFEDEERGFSVTIPHIELAEALKAGYRVTRVYRAYIWPLASDWSPFLFHTYLEKFLKMKFEASGYPAACSEEGISEEEAAARKKAYIDKAWSVCQVRLNPDRIKYNAGLRYVAKLCLNSLWGRFALRNRLMKTEIIDNHADLAKLLNDDKIEISSIDQLTEKFWMVCYKAKDEHVVEHDTSNVALALWTTSAARIHLLDSLQKVSRAADGTSRKDTRVLYMDTDSIFYEYETALGDPLPGGEQLDSGPIDFHDAFFGGRTGPEWLGASVINAETGELRARTIKIKDFNSLYPSRQAADKF